MKTIYLAHALSAPTREGIDENRRLAAEWGGWIVREFAPLVRVSADWIWLTGVLDDHDPNMRKLGLAMDLAAIDRCDEFWLVGSRRTSGMHTELYRAEARGLRIRDLTFHGLATAREFAASVDGQKFVEAVREEWRAAA